MSSPSQGITDLLVAWRNGDQSALNRLIRLVYNELRHLAHRQMVGQPSGHTLETTALVHEAYFRLLKCQRIQWQDRAHFFAVSARLMRQILVDIARSHHRQKRGGGTRALSLAANFGRQQLSPDLLALHEALERLAEFDPRRSSVVELKFFGGLTVEEIAEVLNVSPQTVMRDWHLAKSWLLHELAHDHGR